MQVRKCIECDKFLSRSANYSGAVRCHKCARNNRPIKPKNICVDCKKVLSNRLVIRCGSCSHIQYFINNPVEKEVFYCSCGKERCKSASLCRSCHDRIYRGANHHSYINGETIKDYIGFTERLKKEIRERDYNKCQICSLDNDEHLLIYNCSLSVHHIDYDKKNPAKTNLITLCIQCHLRTNYDRSYWSDYFKTNTPQGEVLSNA